MRLPGMASPHLTNADVAAAAGVTESEARRFWRALGLPDAGDEAAFSEDDLAALTDLKAAAERAGLDLGTAVQLARTVGQNVARMSEWQVAAIASRSAAQAPGRAPDTVAVTPLTSEQRSSDVMGVSTAVTDALQEVLLHAWRRHFAAALTRLDPTIGGGDAVEQVVSVTVGFADLVAFSALSNDLDPERLGGLVEILDSRCADVVPAQDGRMIKTLGDSVLFVSGDADRAMDIASGLIEVIGQDPRLPDVALGLATGPVVTRLGDVFGPPVNLAARLTALARRNRVLADEATVAQLSQERYDVRRLTARPVRGFGMLEPVAVRRR